MTGEILADQIVSFLSTQQACKLARRFHADPMEAAGYIFICLARRIPVNR